jgi:leader peptidase (prepilin peptidase)/N-methyltransferase
MAENSFARRPSVASGAGGVYGDAYTLMSKAVVGGAEIINGWSSAAGWVAPVACAPILGSFAGVLIARVPEGRGVVWGRSACEACGHALGGPDLVPLASFVVLRGRCRYCGAPIGWRHLWVELAALGLAIWAALRGESGGLLWAGCALGWTLMTLGWIDAVCQRLPDFLTLPLVLGGLCEALLLEPGAVPSRAIGAVAGYTGFRLLAWLFLRLRGREGLGQGDAKLLAAGGAWVGAWLLPDVLLAAAGTALVFALRKGRPEPGERIPFGPFLAAGIWLMWLYG